MEFLAWAARYAVDTPGMPLAMALRGLQGAETKVGTPAGRDARVTPVKPTPARTRVLAAAREPIARTDLARAAERLGRRGPSR